MILLVKTSGLKEVVSMIFLLIIFLLILVASYYFSKWFAKSGVVKAKTKNMEVLECFSMGTGKQIQLMKIGKKYFIVAVTKEHITSLGEISEDDLDLSEDEIAKEVSFRDLFQKMQETRKKSKTEKKKMDEY